MNRRNFIRTGLAGLAVVGSGVISKGCTQGENPLAIDKVKLGNTGLTVPRIAMGTGTAGYGKSSNQTRSGQENFTKLVRHAYEKGVSFYDMADNYGSHTFVREALKGLPREKVTLLTKVFIHEDGSEHNEPLKKILDRFRIETGSDYFDILLIHYMTQGGWAEVRKQSTEEFSEAKREGIVKTVGVSCHNIDALAEAAVNPWVDVIMARLNPFGTNMDGSPEDVVAILETAKNNGKGIIGMKIFGEGKHVTDPERQQSLEFAINEGNVHCMTIGFEAESQIDDAVERVMKIVKAG